MMTKRRAFLTYSGLALLALSNVSVKAATHASVDLTMSLFEAVMADNDRKVSALLAKGVDPNVLDEKNNCALSIALQNELLHVADLLIAHPKVDVNILNTNEESPLMFAAIKGLLTQAQALIARGAHVNKTGWTPLHYACTQENVAVTALMIEHHAYIDAASPNQTTPLMMAAGYGSKGTVQLLIEEGADPMLKNEQGLSAYDFAVRAERKDVAQVILQAMRATQPSGW